MGKIGSKFVVGFLAVVLYLSIPISSITYAAEVDDVDLSVEELVDKDESKEVTIDENGIETTKVTDPMTLKSIEEKLDEPKGNGKLKSFVIQKDTKMQEKLNDENSISPRFITSIQQTYIGESCGSKRIAYVSGMGPLSLEVSRSVGTEVSANVNIGLDKLGAELGRTIKTSYAAIGSTTYTPGPRGGEIVAYAAYINIGFDVYRFGLKAESGYVLIADGVCFAEYDH